MPPGTQEGPRVLQRICDAEPRSPKSIAIAGRGVAPAPVAVPTTTATSGLHRQGHRRSVCAAAMAVGRTRRTQPGSLRAHTLGLSASDPPRGSGRYHWALYMGWLNPAPIRPGLQPAGRKGQACGIKAGAPDEVAPASGDETSRARASAPRASCLSASARPALRRPGRHAQAPSRALAPPCSRRLRVDRGSPRPSRWGQRRGGPRRRARRRSATRRPQWCQSCAAVHLLAGSAQPRGVWIQKFVKVEPYIYSLGARR